MICFILVSLTFNLRNFTIGNVDKRELTIMPGYRVSVSKGGAVQLPALVSLAAVSGLAVIISILLWRIHYDGGFTWNSDPAKQFSWHPLLMSTCIILLGIGSIIYRVTPFWSR